MAQYISGRNFLVRQEELSNGKKKDIHARRGEKIELSDREAVKFWGGLRLEEKDKKRLLQVSKQHKYARTI